MGRSRNDDAALASVRAEVIACDRCARLVAWRNEAAAHPPAAHAGEAYWARGLPGFGEPGASLVVVGLAPAAHGGNRTGRLFTGDRSGDFLVAALHRAGYASQPTSVSADDGLELLGAFITSPVRCAPPGNRPSTDERRACAPYLSRELAALSSARVIVALGAFAYDCVRRERLLVADGRPPRFAHGAEMPARLDGRAVVVVCSYHPSQRNVFTKVLTEAMLDAVFARATALGARPGRAGVAGQA